jgi:hypothetical protein
MGEMISRRGAEAQRDGCAADNRLAHTSNSSAPQRLSGRIIRVASVQFEGKEKNRAKTPRFSPAVLPQFHSGGHSTGAGGVGMPGGRGRAGTDDKDAGAGEGVGKTRERGGVGDGVRAPLLKTEKISSPVRAPAD